MNGLGSKGIEAHTVQPYAEDTGALRGQMMFSRPYCWSRILPTYHCSTLDTAVWLRTGHWTSLRLWCLFWKSAIKMLLLGRHQAAEVEESLFPTEERAGAKTWDLKEHLWGPLTYSGGVGEVSLRE